MDWKVLTTTFGLIFLAELGDKTQLGAFTLAARTSRPWTVFLGASAALVAVTALGVGLGDLIRRLFPERIMNISSAVLFLLVGAWLLIKALFFDRPA